VVFDAVPEIYRFVSDGDLVFTMWESSRLPKSAVDAINKGQCCITTCQYYEDSFRQSGVKVPIHIVPLGINTSIYKPGERSPNGTFRIGASCRFSPDGNPRKNVDKIIEAFVSAFHHRCKVELILKGYDSGIRKAFPDKRISVVSEFWGDDNKMADWYRSLDAFVNVPSGGGWELHLQEAMACGAIPIANPIGGSSAFFKPECGYIVDHRLSVPNWDPYNGIGEWQVPNVVSIAENMKRAFDNRGKDNDRIRASVESASKHTWDSASKTLNSLLIQYNA
jgi:glycosyltransferase involved in cell wall biosynthesis